MYGDNEGRHRHKMQARRASSQHARVAPSQPLPGQPAVTRELKSEQRGLKGHNIKSRHPRRSLAVSKPANARLASKLMGIDAQSGRADVLPTRSGFRYDGESLPGRNNVMVEAVLAQREAARVAGDYATADRLRAMLRSMGVDVYDDARFWRWKQ